jgi:hypothetical protein
MARDSKGRGFMTLGGTLALALFFASGLPNAASLESAA